MSFDREHVKARVAELAARGVFVGTSSWRYLDWMEQLYSPARYEYRSKVAKTRFERDCLTEYAEIFKMVSVDAAYYLNPASKSVAQVKTGEQSMFFRIRIAAVERFTGDSVRERFFLLDLTQGRFGCDQPGKSVGTTKHSKGEAVGASCIDTFPEGRNLALLVPAGTGACGSNAPRVG